MTTMTKVFEEDRRLEILLQLSAAPAYTINEHILKRVLVARGHPETTRDLLQADLLFLEQHRLVEINRLGAGADEMFVVKILARGEEVSSGTAHPGIARPLPKG